MNGANRGRPGSLTISNAYVCTCAVCERFWPWLKDACADHPNGRVRVFG